VQLDGVLIRVMSPEDVRQQRRAVHVSELLDCDLLVRLTQEVSPRWETCIKNGTRSSSRISRSESDCEACPFFAAGVSRVGRLPGSPQVLQVTLLRGRFVIPDCGFFRHVGAYL
jgi:hypothetical protein